MRVCADCKKEQPFSNYHTSGRGYRANCKSCRAKIDRSDKLRRHYNITPVQYDTLLYKQGGVCRICSMPETLIDNRTGEVMSLAVDHDHSCCPGTKTCGKCIRGLLCARCNTAIGLLEDDPVLLSKAIIYLLGAKNA